MTAAQLRAKFPNASPAFIRANSIPDYDPCAGACAELERGHARQPLEADDYKAPGSARFRVRVACRRSTLLDLDNVCEKFAVDCLRIAGIIPNDSPREIDLETTQEICRAGEDETILTVEEI